jgi:hypothetical protein
MLRESLSGGERCQTVKGGVISEAHVSDPTLDV